MAKKTKKQLTLENALAEPASQETWDRICSALTRWREPSLSEEAIPLALEALAEWPASTPRPPAASWRKRLIKGEDDPRMLLCNTLEFENGPKKPTADELAALQDSPAFERLTNIHTLTFHRAALQYAALDLWLHAPSLTGVRHLTLHNHAYGSCAPQRTSFHGESERLTQLVYSPRAKTLEALALQSNWLEARDAKHLVKSDCWGALKRLDLHNNNLGPAGAKVLAKASALSNIEELELGYNNIGAAGLEALVKSKNFPRLRRLGLRSNIRDKELLALVDTPLMNQLEELDLRGSWITDETLSALVHSPTCSNLRSLDMISNKLTKQGALMLASTPHLESLRSLTVDTREMGLEGREVLEDWSSNSPELEIHYH